MTAEKSRITQTERIAFFAGIFVVICSSDDTITCRNEKCDARHGIVGKEHKMKAAVYHSRGKICLEERPMPEIISDTDAVVEVTLTTICSSDIHIKPVSYTHLI